MAALGILARSATHFQDPYSQTLTSHQSRELSVSRDTLMAGTLITSIIAASAAASTDSCDGCFRADSDCDHRKPFPAICVGTFRGETCWVCSFHSTSTCAGARGTCLQSPAPCGRYRALPAAPCSHPDALRLMLLAGHSIRAVHQQY